MKTVNTHEAKTHLSKLLERAASGEDIIIAKAGKPVAKLGPLDKNPIKRKGGFWKGRVEIVDNFDDPLPEEILVPFTVSS